MVCIWILWRPQLWYSTSISSRFYFHNAVYSTWFINAAGCSTSVGQRISIDTNGIAAIAHCNSVSQCGVTLILSINIAFVILWCSDNLYERAARGGAAPSRAARWRGRRTLSGPLGYYSGTSGPSMHIHVLDLEARINLHPDPTPASLHCPFSFLCHKP